MSSDPFEPVWPLSLITADAYHHMTTGPVVVGRVRTVVRDDITYYAIQDGGFWHHPGLQPYLGQDICVHFDAVSKAFTLQTWPRQQTLADLPEVPMN